jgi:hypothetical protein
MYIDIMHIKLLTLKDTQETNLKHLKILLIVAVSFIGGGNWRKPLTYSKSLTNFIT